MHRTLKIALNITVSSNINWLLYYLKQTPIIGKLFKKSDYVKLESKREIATIFLILKMMSKFITSGIMIFMVLYVPLLIIMPKVVSNFPMETDGIGSKAFLHLYFFVYCLANGFLNCYTLEPSRMKFISVKLMHMDASQYCVSMFLYQRIWNLIVSLPTFIFLSTLFQMTWQQGLLLCIVAKLIGFMGESIHLLYFHKFHKPLHKKMILLLSIAVLFIGIAIIPLLFDKALKLSDFLFHPVFIIVMLGLGILSLRYIIRFPDYKEGVNISNQLVDIEALNVQQVKKNSRFADVKLNEKKFTREELVTEKFVEKRGYEYLNSLFFARHKNQIIRPILLRAAIILAFIFGGIIASYTLDIFSEKWLKALLKLYPVLIFVMYFLSLVVQRATRAMFYNCDVSLLHYGFYKKGDALLRMFWLRLRVLCLCNLIPAGLLAVGILVISSLNHSGDILGIIPIAIFVIVLSLFFTVHHLFLYYILQPYTSEMGMKSPLYSVINFITYMVCWLSLQINIVPGNFMIIIMGATICYMLLALVLVSRYASKTFNVK